MFRQSTLSTIASEQKQALFADSETMIKRSLFSQLPNTRTHALILSGIRRCGKSTLLKQFVRQNFPDVFYLNFEDIRLYGFNINDFVFLDKVIEESGLKVLYFDEIQNIPGWELFVRQKLDSQFQVIITGSNASLLSVELGTKLTGRHITKELFPFSYSEYIDLRESHAGSQSLLEYLNQGGFPEFVKQQIPEILEFLIEDILNRDIIVRYGIKDSVALKKLCSYALANNGTLTVPSKLTSAIGVKSATTVLNFFTLFENSYLLAMIPRFSWSHKSQLLHPKKMYVVDPGLVQIGSTAFSRNYGHLLESVVYWHLRRQTKEIWYFQENDSECDFVVRMKDGIFSVIQVCWELNEGNENREIKGLVEAMKYFDTKNGLIISFDSRDTINTEAGIIEVIPAWDYLLKV